MDDYRTQSTLHHLQKMWGQTQEKPNHPAEWARHTAGIHLWSKQREICTSVMENKKTAVRAGHGVGKSLCAATVACWWIDSHPIGEAFVISTAPSTAQVHAVLWAEIGRVHKNGSLAGDIQLSDNWVIGRTLVGQGRKPHDHNKHAFQGLHRKYVLVVIDEACGIPEWIWNAVETVTTGEHCRILAIGNPDDPSSHFAKVCKPGSGWNSIRISVLDSPNFTGEVVDPELQEVLPKQGWVDDKRKIWGENSPMWTAKVLGEFSELDEYAVIPYSWVAAANQRFINWDEAGRSPLEGNKIIGVDVAGRGKNQTVFAHRIGVCTYKLEKFKKQDTEDIADLLDNRLNIHDDMTAIDANGIGTGVFDKLRRRGFNVRAFMAQARTNVTDRSREYGFLNVRSAAWWNMRELLDPAFDSDIMLVPDENLAAQLITPRWREVTGAKIAIESKDEISARVGTKNTDGGSSDEADAVIIAFFYTSGTLEEGDFEAIAWADKVIENGAISWAHDDGILEQFGFDDKFSPSFVDVTSYSLDQLWR